MSTGSRRPARGGPFPLSPPLRAFVRSFQRLRYRPTSPNLFTRLIFLHQSKKKKKRISDLRADEDRRRRCNEGELLSDGKTDALVPKLDYLHSGHLSADTRSLCHKIQSSEPRLVHRIKTIISNTCICIEIHFFLHFTHPLLTSVNTDFNVLLYL